MELAGLKCASKFFQVSTFQILFKKHVIAFFLLESQYNLLVPDPSLNVRYFAVCQGVAICYCKAGL